MVAEYERAFTKSFSRIYVLNLRGNARTQGELRQKEAGSLFGGGSKAAIAITILIKDPEHVGPAEILYCDIGDYLTTEQKREKLTALRSIKGIAWQTLEPDVYEDWLNQRDQQFPKFIPLGDNRKTSNTSALFEMYSLGVASNRDAWAYNFSLKSLKRNVKTTFDFFNSEVERFLIEEPEVDLKNWVHYSTSDIAWSRDFLKALKKTQLKELDPRHYVESVYRPFSKRQHYFARTLNNEVYRMPLLFPGEEISNRVICVEEKGSSKPFSCLMVDHVTDLSLMAHAQCFPLYYQSELPTLEPNTLEIELSHESGSADGMRYAMSDQGLSYFQRHYPEHQLDKESLFYYIYGILHSPDYRDTYQSNLYRELARIPVVSSYEDFLQFSNIGKRLGDLHVNYESAELPEKVKVNTQIITKSLIESFNSDDLRVTTKKMPFRSKATGSGANRAQNKSAIVFNHAITVTDIPDSAYEYVVNGKPAIEWIMDQYRITVNEKTGIKNDPNDYAIEIAKDPAYILKLLLRVITVSLRTNELVTQLPKLEIQDDFMPYEKFRQSIK